MIYDAIIIGGGPSGATAATELALQNRKVAFIDREGRIKPCGGAVPPRLIRDFNIPDNQIVAKIKTAIQLLTIGLYLFALTLSLNLLIVISDILLIIATLITLYTGFHYAIEVFKK